MSVSKKIFSLALMFILCGTALATPWSSFGPKRKPVTLVITANYVTPRLLAELILNESGQPYLLLPAADQDNKKIFFCSRKNNNTMVVAEKHLNRFINFLGVKRIIVLGNADFVPQRYIDMLDHNTPVMRIESSDWYRIAEELNFMLNLSDLDKNFKKLREALITEGRRYRPLKGSDAPKQVKAADDAAAVPAASELPAEK
jgi:hypothetical protein